MWKRSDGRWLTTPALAAAALCVGLAVRSASGSETLDPTVPERWMVGPPRGAAPMQRIDGARSGKSQSALPTAPRVLWRARIQGGIAHPAVVDERGSVVVSSPIAVVTDRGDVYEWRSGAEPSKLGSFGGGVSGAALHGSRLIAVVDGKRLVDLDLVTSTRHERVEIPRGLGGPPALGADGSTRVVTLDGLLLAHDRTGKETLRVALEPPTVLGDAGATGFASSASPPVIVDAKGNVGFVRPGLDAGVVDPAGSIHAATGAACLDPVGVTPAGPDRMLLACRSGVVFLLGR